MAAYEYKAFVSYSHADRRFARWLQSAIETYRVPPGIPSARLRPVFRDRDDLVASGDLGAAVLQALRDSEFLIVLCSPAAARSRWVEQEVLHFKAMHGEERVLPVILRGRPFAGDPQTECFPDSLRHHVDADRNVAPEDFEPLAADVPRDGRRRALSKVVAALLGVKLDRLIQRENARQLRRLVAATGATAAGLVVAVGLAVTAWVARNDAEAQRAEAESLVEFMLTDLREKLEPVGRLDALASVGRRAQTYYQRVPSSELDAASLARSARALILIGEIDNLRGDLDNAARVFAEAHATTAELLTRAPADAERIHDHAQSAFWLSYLDWQRGRREPARRGFREYRDLGTRLVAAAPGDAGALGELGYAESNLGTLDLEQGRFEAAERRFRASLEAFEKAAALSPDEVVWRIEVGHSRAWLADALREQLQLDAAIGEREAELALYRALVRRHPADHRVRARIASAQRALGDLSLAGGEFGRARAKYERAIAVATELLAFEPENTQWIEIAAGARLDLALLDWLVEGSFDPTALERARALAEQLARLDPDVALWRLQLLARARLFEAASRPPDVRRTQLDEVVRQIREATSDIPSAPRDLLVEALGIRASLDPLQAHGDWNEIIEIVEGLEYPGLRVRSLQVRAFREIGDDERGPALLAILHEAGYRHPWFTRPERTGPPTAFVGGTAVPTASRP